MVRCAYHSGTSRANCGRLRTPLTLMIGGLIDVIVVDQTAQDFLIAASHTAGVVAMNKTLGLEGAASAVAAQAEPLRALRKVRRFEFITSAVSRRPIGV